MTSNVPSSPDNANAAAPRPLDGIRVLDLTWGMIGSLTTMMLADHGAEVIKVERPGGDPARRAGAGRTWDRGKRSVVLDFADDHDVGVLRQLCTTADIVVDGLGNGRLASRGLACDELRRANPALVYCALSSSGPELDEPQLGYDILAAARFGVMAESPGHRAGPIFPGHPAVAYGTAFLAVIGTLSALRARLVTGTGDRVDVSTRDGVLALMGMNWWSERRLSFIAARSPTGRLDMGRRRLLLERYTCADGTMIQVHTGAAGAFGRLMTALGIDTRISPAEGRVETGSELSDDDLRVLRTEVPEIFRRKSAEAWMRHLWQHEVACLPVQPPGVVFDDEQVRHAGVIRETDDPELGMIEVVGPTILFSGNPAPITRAAPELDADGDAVRASGWQSPGLDDLPAEGSLPEHPLSGVRIVELSNWFASPSGNRLLRDLGADVTKVEALSGDPIRPLPDPCEGANGGKRSIAVDLKNPLGRTVVERLIAAADVVQHNMRPGAAERLGIDGPRVRALNAQAIYAYGPGYGSSGPKSQLQSFAPLMSGFVGLMHIAAGDGNEPHTCFGNEDYYAGLLSAVGILTALVHRERTGVGQSVETTQLLASVLVTSEHYLRDGTPHSVLPRLDGEQTGWSPTYRIYQCLLGWLCVACVSERHVDTLLATVLPGDAPDDASDLAQALIHEFFGRSADDWEKTLSDAGVPCQAVREEAWLPDFLADDENVASGATVEFDHPLHGRVRVVGEMIHIEHRPARTRSRSPLLGEHTHEVLGELGFTGEQISALRAAGVVAGEAPMRTS